jgi:chaperone required for assembly of F1-ATPase
VLQAVTNLGSVVLGILLAQQRLEVDQAVSALTVTASYVARRSHEEPEPSEMFAAEMQQMVRRLMQYVQLSA